MWNIYQSAHHRRARHSADQANDRASSLRADLSGVLATLDRMLMVNRAMWEILRDRDGLSEADLLAKIEEIDLRDGVRDGRLRREIGECGACGRKLQKRHPRCLYCGEPCTPDPFDG